MDWKDWLRQIGMVFLAVAVVLWFFGPRILWPRLLARLRKRKRRGEDYE
jgi:hypothetical protein